jgi:hypothetical protein
MDRAWATDRMKKDDSIARAFAFREGYMAEAQSIACSFEDASAMTATRSGDGGAVHLAIIRNGHWEWLEAGGMMQSAVPVRNNVRPHPAGLNAASEIAASLGQALQDGRMESETANRMRREIRLLRGDHPPTVVALQQDENGVLSGYAVRAGSKDLCLFAYDNEIGLQTMRLS